MARKVAMMTKEVYVQQKSVMNWFYNQPQGATVLVRNCHNRWINVENPNFCSDVKYVINDDFSDIRIAVYMKRKIECYNSESKSWDLFNIIDPNYNFPFSPENYRIKELGDDDYPIFKKNSAIIVKFIDAKTMIPVFIFNPDELKLVGYLNNSEIIGASFASDINGEEWTSVAYDPARELYEGQPIVCWNDIDKAIINIGFYMIEPGNRCAFDASGGRVGQHFDNYKPYKDIMDEWIVEAYKNLKFK